MADPLPPPKPAHQAKAPPRKKPHIVHKPVFKGKPVGWGSGRAKHTLKGAPLANQE